MKTAINHILIVSVMGLLLLCGYLYGRMSVGEQVQEQMRIDKEYCDSIALQRQEVIQILKTKYK